MLDKPLSVTPDQNDESPASLVDNQIREPLAIIGIGCHFPGGATSPQAFWEMLCSGVDATREIPTDRWDVRKFYDPDIKKSGKLIATRGGYLERLDQFDAHFFGISPREATWIDPQQRLLLQVTWEALEDAGLVAEHLAGSNTGVFIGGFTLDYHLMHNFGSDSRYELQTHSAAGMMMTMMANRLSYVFGFHGPSLAVDTACSASLAAVHLACQSIWNGECDLAIAGGANAMIVPTMTIAESKAGFLSPDGRCKAFDASGNGYARGEGAGVILIKPLARALADGDRIYSAIRGTAVTQDGRTYGITVPNGDAQEAAMRLAQQRAGVAPHQIQYIEAHGTGTPVGDPIEAKAIGRAMSTGRSEEQKCVIGSVKTNIGHLEAAAGIAGVIKVSLALQHRQIPPHLHFHNPHPDIPFDELRLRIPTKLEAWPATEGPAMAGVNSFGFGGTNAHVVLQEAPVRPERREEPEDDGTKPVMLPLSARSAEALQAVAHTYRDFLTGEEIRASIRDIAYSASLRRSHHDHRMALVAHSREEAVRKLDAFLAGDVRSGVVMGRVGQEGLSKIAFVCSGMGPQWWAMARDLLENEPVFRASIERCDLEFRKHADWSLMEALRATEEESRISETEVGGPTNFAIQVALAELWRSWGIQPDAVVGHSVGEVASYYLAGALSLEDAICVIYHRSRLQQRTTGLGRMLAVGMTTETLNQAIHERGVEDRVSIAAINSPSSVTLVGDAEILEDMARHFQTFQVFHRFLHGNVPSHSHYMDPLREELLSSLADLKPLQTTLPLYSTVTGTRIDGSSGDASYWWQNVRATVLFSSAITQMIQDGYTTFIELSPHPVLASSIAELLAQQGQTGRVLPSLRRKEKDRAIMLGSLGALYTTGYPIDWQVLYPQGGTFVHLPSYPWQFKTYWTETLESREDRLYSPVHPLLGQRIGAVHPTWELELNTHQLPYLVDHRIQENILLPGAAFVEMALAAAHEVFGEGNYLIEELTFHKALFVIEASDLRVRTMVNEQDASVEISSYTPTASEEMRWTLHASARLQQRQVREAGTRLDGSNLNDGYPVYSSKEEVYQRAHRMGLQYGPAFQAVEHVASTAGKALGQLQVPDMLAADLATYCFHPALLDAAFQVLLMAAMPAAIATDQKSVAPYLPVGIERLHVSGQAQQRMQVYAHLRQADERYVVGDIQVVDMEGTVLAEIEGFRAQSLEASLSLTPEHIDKCLYELEWQPQEREELEATRQPGSGSWLIFIDHGGVGEALARRLAAQGISYVTVGYADGSKLVQEDGHYVLDPSNPEHFQQLFQLLGETQHSFATLVHLWSLDSTFNEDSALDELDREQKPGALSVVYLIQKLSQTGWAQMPLLWLVTRQAQVVGAHQRQIAIAQAPVWGLGRVIGHQEFVSMWGGLIDLDAATITEQAEQLFAEITYGSHEDQIAFREGQRYVVRLKPSTHLTPPLPVSFRPDGAYLVTGGLGNLGLLVARWLVTHGARRLLLTGRTPIPARSTWSQLEESHPQKEAVRTLQELENLGATIQVVAVDVADEEQMSTFLAEYERESRPPIRGVIHTAGVVQDELLLRMSTETYLRVQRPKLRGGWVLHRVFKDIPLDFFVLFSSTGSTIASLGQGNYAAANAFLDILAQYRRMQGLPALCISWGPWSVGMVERLKLEQFYIKHGIDLFTPESGIPVLSRVIWQRPAHLLAVSANWTTARETSPTSIPPGMYSQLEAQVSENSGDEESGDESILHTIRATQSNERLPLVATYLQEIVARVLQLDAAQFTHQEVLTSLGMDSMMAIEVKNRIAISMKVDISVLELLQGVTIAQLASRILASLQLDEGEVVAESEPLLDEIKHLIEQADSDELERLLAELEQSPSENKANV
jgi:acyl transferase domain-containing protein/aryl carrier-like protein